MIVTDRKSLFLGWVGFALLVVTTIGSIFLYSFILGDKPLLVFGLAVLTDVILFGGLIFLYYKIKKRKIIEQAPNAYVCPNCQESIQIKFVPPDLSYAIMNCPKCGTIMDLKIVDYLPRAIPKSGCWIATAVYGDPFHPEVEKLRDFRDIILDTTKFGRECTKLYYKTSPPIADAISGSLLLRKIFKFLMIRPSIKISESIIKLKQENYIQDLHTIRKIVRRRYFSQNYT